MNYKPLSFQDGYVRCSDELPHVNARFEQLVNNIQEVLDKNKPFDQIKMLEVLSVIAFNQAKTYQENIELFSSYCQQLQNLLMTKQSLQGVMNERSG